MADLFTLGNNDFNTFGSKLLQELYHDEKSKNVTLVSAELKTIEAHKAVLIIASDFFKEFFKAVKLDNPVIYLKNVKFIQLDRIIKFLYLG